MNLGMLTWISIHVTHIYFTRAVRLQQIPAHQFAYRATLGQWGSMGALAILCLLLVTKGFQVFIHGFDYKNFIVQYIGLPLYLLCIVGYKLYYRTRRVRGYEADLVTGVTTEPIQDLIDRRKADLHAKNADKPVFIQYCNRFLAVLF